jgi:hypothetical protein
MNLTAVKTWNVLRSKICDYGTYINFFADRIYPQTGSTKFSNKRPTRGTDSLPPAASNIVIF